MGKLRGFEKCKGYEDIAVMPVRKTKGSAGYDFSNTDKEIIIEPGETVVIDSGIRTYMPRDTVLLLFVRSSIGINRGLVLANGTGVIDSDFTGSIKIALHNMSNISQRISPYDRIMQGVFIKYYTTDNDDTTDVRDGGIGSTGN